mmetsp:Transcript_5958/g.11165  ORF Transcript_5958/g.11165 Transcript_5958/m.11165 type:complete len:263 (+) Transcript_5958:538-1326(+)
MASRSVVLLQMHGLMERKAGLHRICHRSPWGRMAAKPSPSFGGVSTALEVQVFLRREKSHPPAAQMLLAPAAVLVLMKKVFNISDTDFNGTGTTRSVEGNPSCPLEAVEATTTIKMKKRRLKRLLTELKLQARKLDLAELLWTLMIISSVSVKGGLPSGKTGNSVRHFGMLWNFSRLRRKARQSCSAWRCLAWSRVVRTSKLWPNSEVCSGWAHLAFRSCQAGSVGLGTGQCSRHAGITTGLSAFLRTRRPAQFARPTAVLL